MKILIVQKNGKIPVKHYIMIVFVHIEKTAGTTLKFIFRNSHTIYHCDTMKTKRYPFTQRDLNFAKRIFPEIKSMTGHNLIEPTKHLKDKNLLFITLLRDPVKRCASYYQDAVLRGNIKIPFTEWIKNEKFHNMQVKRIAGEPDPGKAFDLLNQKYALTGLTEQFDEFLKLLDIISPYSLDLKYEKRIVAKKNDVKQKLLNDDESMHLLTRYNEKDIILYEKFRDELYPMFLTKYANELTKYKNKSFEQTHMSYSKHKLSVIFNKYVYRSFVKIKNLT